jgi:hypothetical protein
VPTDIPRDDRDPIALTQFFEIAARVIATGAAGTPTVILSSGSAMRLLNFGLATLYEQ